MSGDRSFHNLAVLGKKECLLALILEKGIESVTQRGFYVREG